MRHLKRTAKLGRQFEHRNAMLANMVCSLIKHKRIQTTLAKAKAVRSVAEKMVTLGKNGSIHDRRLAAARLHQEDAVRILFSEIAPTQKERNGGYTRIIRLNQRQGDAAELAILEWVDGAAGEVEEPKTEKEEKKPEGGEKKVKKTKKADKADKGAKAEKTKTEAAK
jgi:large subunit ribosomal protein L17